MLKTALTKNLIKQFQYYFYTVVFHNILYFQDDKLLLSHFLLLDENEWAITNQCIAKIFINKIYLIKTLSIYVKGESFKKLLTYLLSNNIWWETSFFYHKT